MSVRRRTGFDLDGLRGRGGHQLRAVVRRHGHLQRARQHIGTPEGALPALPLAAEVGTASGDAPGRIEVDATVGATDQPC